MTEKLKIGELARRTSCQVETIRYYEREGLLPTPPRSGGNFRLYRENHVRQLAFIRHCRSLDMTLDEIRALLHFKNAPTENCGEVNALLERHIEHVQQRVRELRQLERQLKNLREQCSGIRNAGECGILGGLSHATKKSPESAASSLCGTHTTSKKRSKYGPAAPRTRTSK